MSERVSVANQLDYLLPQLPPNVEKKLTAFLWFTSIVAFGASWFVKENPVLTVFLITSGIREVLRYNRLKTI